MVTYSSTALSNHISIRKPSKVNLAQGRLEDAVTWLESVVNLKESSVIEASQTNALLEEIKHLKLENSALKQVNDQVTTRLGDAIKRLSKVIGD